MARIRIMFSRFSAFYSPLIATQAGGFLRAHGLEAAFSVATPERPARQALQDGEAELIQSAVSASWAPLERGETSDVVHFAQVNQRDGFFLAAREPDPAFRWTQLQGAEVLADHGAQPLAMFRYALRREGVPAEAVRLVDAGGPDEMVAAFRAGRGEYVHLQGPAPQQLERAGAAHVVAAVGEAIGPVAFSSLCATRRWLGTEMALAFLQAYRQARSWVNEAPAAEVAKAELGFFPGVDEDVLARTIGAYQRLGTWAGGLEIPRDGYQVTQDVFEHSRLITRRHPYEAVVVPPPQG